MGKYGEAAVKAVRCVQQNPGTDPKTAWKKAVCEIFSNSQASIDKVCPRSTFLSLCEEGRIHGITAESYINAQENKGYALEALSILENDPSLDWTPNSLWKKIQNGGKTHNNQMDVVIALFQEGLTQ